MGVFIGGFIGHRFALGRDGVNRRRAFVKTIATIKSGFDIVDDAGFEKWFALSKPKIAGACAEVGPDIPWMKRRKFHTACDAYAKAQKPEIQDWDTNTSPTELAMRQMQYSTGRGLVRRLVATMLDCSK